MIAEVEERKQFNGQPQFCRTKQCNAKKKKGEITKKGRKKENMHRFLRIDKLKYVHAMKIYGREPGRHFSTSCSSSSTFIHFLFCYLILNYKHLPIDSFIFIILEPTQIIGIYTLKSSSDSLISNLVQVVKGRK